VEEPAGEGGRLVLPLTVKDLPAGVLDVRRARGRFADRDRWLLRAFASQLSIGLENARLYRQLDGLFRQYMARDVATALLADPSQARLGGVVAEVTVLFADLRGFTPFSEQAPPERVVAMLNEYFGRAVPVILANGGSVTQFVGDAVMALFNAPTRQPDHALRAARAALGMQQAIEEAAVREPGWPLFRVGVNTGPALVGNIGSAELRSYTAIGDTVNLAARLEELADAGQVVIGPATYQAIADVAVAHRLEQIGLKGKRQPVTPGSSTGCGPAPRPPTASGGADARGRSAGRVGAQVEVGGHRQTVEPLDGRQRRRRQVPGAGAHPRQLGGLRAVELHGGAEPADRGLPEPGRQAVGHRPLLLRLDADQPDRGGQLGQVRRPRGHHQQQAAGRQEAGELGAVARGEHVQQRDGAVVGQRDPGPGVGHQEAHLRVVPGGPADRVLGDVGAEQARQRAAVGEQALAEAPELVAGAAADVQDATGVGAGARPGGALRAEVPRDQLGDGVGERRVVAAGQEAGAGRHHRLGVPHHAGAPVPGEQQVDVALPGDVEAVAAGAPQRRAGRAQGAAADRADEEARARGLHPALPGPGHDTLPGYCTIGLPRARSWRWWAWPGTSATRRTTSGGCAASRGRSAACSG
jgi:class 3 adenylate cyclase